ncbi:hypothetical protein HOLleu_12914 [Holothuria leucospilota]|uniref:Uncharacterized protein n=1 Tax=Holothuria leucospilota TaxID=206669 RepID=A0A9Q1CBL7_HOLLE|nr:hypothetical protein HOLleu_12914 [Holothuria leucospilota]
MADSSSSKSKQESFIATFKNVARLTADDFLKVWEHYDADGYHVWSHQGAFVVL